MNMKIKGMLKTIAVALGLASAAPAVAGGDIYEILPCNAAGTTVAKYATLNEPLTAGETVYFKVRLAPRTNGGQPWYVDHIGYSSDVVDDALYPLQIGIYVSGQLQFATLVNYAEVKADAPDKSSITDLIFSYKTKVGDFALPIVLAVRDSDGNVKPASEGVESGSYYLDPTGAGKWKITNATTSNPEGDEVQLTYWSSPGPTYPGSALTSASLTHNREADYSLSSCGFYVQTIDFDSTWESEDEADPFWRSVHQGSTATIGAAPKVVATSALEDAVTVYVWSTNDTSVTVVGGKDVEMIVDYNAGTPVKQTFKVGTVTIAGGRASADFSIKGVTQDTKANLVLSPWKGYNYDGSNDRVIDYVTVPVKCVEPLPASIVVERDDATVFAPTAADDAYLTAVTRLTIYATQAPKENVTVTIDPVFQADATKTNWGDYLRFSTSDSLDTLPDADKPVVVLEKDKTEKKFIYVYALRSEKAFTLGTGKQIQLKPVADEAELEAAGVKSVQGTGLFIDASAPVITSPTSETVLTATAGSTLEIPIAVNDTFADMFDTATGYTVSLGFNGSEQAQGTTFVPTGDGYTLVGKDDDTKVPQITIPATVKGGDYTVTVMVTSPIRKLKSAVTSFKVTVTPAKSSKAEVTDAETDYMEGANVHYKVTLSDAPGQVVYAFLVNYDDAADGTFGGTGAKAIIREADLETKVTTSKGVRINADGTTAVGLFTLQDGASEEVGGTTYQFGVVLCTSQVYDPAKVVVGFPTTDIITITTYNKEPAFDAAEAVFVNGIAVKNGDTLENEYPKGQEQKIVPNISDVNYDLKHGFKYRYTISRGGKPVKTATIGHENTADWEPNADETIADGTSINASAITYDFPVAGLYTIKIQLQDKDLREEGENKWAADVLTFSVSIIDQPQVSLDGDDGRDTFLENELKQHVVVGLSYFPDSGETMVVKVTVTPPAGDNAGVFTLDEAYKTVPDGYPALADDEYYVTFSSIAPQSLLIEAMDGTTLSSTKGFTLKAEVMNTTESLEPGKAWKDYFKPYTKKFYVENVTPTFSNVTEPSTNAWTVAGGLATSRPIKFGIKNDVDNDLQGITSFPGIKVTISGCESGEITPAVASHTDPMEFYIAAEDPRSYTFVPNFGSVQGDQVVTLTIADKDGGEETWTYLYTITPSKFLKTVPNGPSGTGNSAVSQKYSTAKGRGEGHIYVQGAIFSGEESFIASWNCSKAASASLFGFGYQILAPEDNGTLNNGRDEAIDKNGKSGAAADFYRYTAADAEKDEDKKDSFLYAWLTKEASGQESGTSGDFSVSIAPETPTEVGKPATVSLPTEETQDGAYAETFVEAVFAKEWMVSDNLGDINQDGIPDYFMIRTWGGGKLLQLVADADEDSNADLTDLATSNPDEDLLPGVFTGAGTAFAGSNGNSYAPIGVPFTTRMEIRGFADGLNATDVTKSDIDFSEDEQRAYTAATGNAYDPATVNLNEWSPEPGTAKIARMDPTLADTDGDGFPDGWEYYFWYMAHVWVPAGADAGQPRNGQKFVFERFTTANVIEGVEIPAAEVEARYNPCDPLEPKALKDKPDFDNDGLSDLEELVLGTNPCHWDTDGDHMCDGWEVMMGLDPLNGAQQGNPDGDFMAYMSTLRTVVRVVGDDPYAAGTTIEVIPGLAQGQDYDFDEETLEPVMLRTVTKKGFTFQPKMGADGTPLTYGLLTDMLDKDPEETGWGFNMVENIQRVELTFEEGDVLNANTMFVLIHDQVREAFEFDPRTGWYMNSNGYVADRWDPSVNKDISPFDVTGYAVNTRPYYTYDEYLVMKYRLDYNIVYTLMPLPEGVSDDTWTLLRSKTTMPTVIQAAAADTDDTAADDDADADADDTTTDAAATDTSAVDAANAVAAAFQASGSTKTPYKGHGADTDGDGVPDGWELYMFRNPNAGPTDDEDGMGLPKQRDFDGDTLSWAAEYAGTDSCNAYKGCASIYNNHPGLKSGWYNKFFPTNPGTIFEYGQRNLKGDAAGADTDCDGVTDADEGGTWGTDFYVDGKVVTDVVLGAIYGEPTDDGSCCIRGGGMNPCTIDTDLDGIPDAWEMQHVGVPVDTATFTAVPPKGATSKPDVEFTASTFIADGFTNSLAEATATTNTSSVVYLAGGMDPTWNGDAVSGKKDELLGRVRDVDFDHDGLQNYQEYLVQSLRHLRYDDVTTPLMGRQLEEGTYDPLTDVLLTPHEQKYLGFTVFDSASVDVTVENAAADWNDATVITKHLENAGTGYQKKWDEAAWRALGYFASPTWSWDRSLTCALFMDPVYMLPVTGKIVTINKCAGYVSTDPRMADTDGDGMDDYYEVFHGLNPILGSDPGTPEQLAAATEWQNGKKGDIISAVYYMTVYPLGDNRATFNAYYNAWTYPTFNMKLGLGGAAPCTYAPILAPEAYDPVLYPWIMGSPLADADSDGIRNTQEAILANTTTPQPRHTDPTPAWFTERTTPASYAAQYYTYPARVASAGFSWMLAGGDQIASAALEGGTTDYLYAFEEGEGYDTDNDWVPDSREIVTTATAATDPLRFDDPMRRQAVWFPGANAFLMTTERQARPINAADLLTQFTVECWVRPEQTGADQTIIERSCLYLGDNMNNDAYASRATFRSGLTADGRVYGMFDNNDAIESGLNQPVSCQIINGRELPLNEWSHVALSYDGSTLKLFVNGQINKSVETHLSPANGVTIIRQNPGSTDLFQSLNYTYMPCALFIGARPTKDGYPAMATLTEQPGEPTFANFREFYKGYVDEVRVWDGARTEKEISDAYLRRFTMDDVKANRESVYAAWKPVSKDGELTREVQPNASRNDQDGKPMLPAELVHHYNFVNLPGAVKAADVAKTPTGFSSKVLGAAMSDYASNDQIVTDGLYVDADMTLKGGAGGAIAGDLEIGWWKACQLHSTVYSDYHVIPWIENTVAHLPMMDGSCVDSFLYHEYVGGSYLTAVSNNVAKYVFPNSAVPYASVVYGTDRATRVFTLGRLFDANVDEDSQELYFRYAFHIRGKFLGSSDLVPMGGAYAKTCDMMWDGSAGDQWEYTGTDEDGDGLPDWWEEYARNNYCSGLDPAEALNWDTVVTYKGLQMTAAQAYLIDIAMGMQPDGTIDPAYAATADSDHNGIPDWWERLFGVEGTGLNADSDNDGLSNYVEYLMSFVFDLGQIFDPKDAYSANPFDIDYFFPIGSLYAGELFTDNDMIEDAWEDEYAYANRYTWDQQSDRDQNGWTTLDEARAIKDKDTWIQVGTETNLVVRTFVYGSNELSVFLATNQQEIAVTEYLSSNGIWYNGWIGGCQAQRFTLVEESPVMDYCGHPLPKLSLTFSYNGKQVLKADDTADQNNATTDTETTAVTYSPIIIRTYTDKDVVVADAEYTVTPTESLVRQPQTLVVHQPVEGFAKGGKNTIVAFCDLDGDGEYTPGEPFGMVRNVEIGWHQATAAIELTDTTAIITRMKLEAIGDAGDEEGSSGTASTDRYVLYGNEDGDYRQLIAGELAGGEYQRVRVVRTLINGYSIDTLKIPNTTVVDKWIHLKRRPYICEADVLSDTEFDLDWSRFQSEVMNASGVTGNKIDVTNVVYRIVLGNGTIETTETNNLFAVATVRHFDPTKDRVLPTLVSPGVGGDSVVYGTRPTFTWSMGTYNSYTAFQLQVLKGGSVVWDTGVRSVPPRDGNGNYSFVPDVYLGDLLQAGEKYTWRVAMYNAKFQTAEWSPNVQTFAMASATPSYGTIGVCVKYFGPALDTGTIRVEAFTTPDFTGAPVARTFVADTTDVSTYGVLHTANATLSGLEEGTYYVRAYLDTNSRGEKYTKDSWESWGCACPRELSEQMFVPSAVVVSRDAVAQVILVNVEDTDINGNNLPDAWEYANGGALNAGANNVTEVVAGGVALNAGLTALLEREDAKLPGGLVSQVAATLSSASVQAMVFGVDVPEGGSLAAVVADATEVVDGSVAITDAVFNQTAKTVTLTVEADVENAYAGTLASSLYTFNTTSAQVTCIVWRKASLAEAGWTKVAEKPVTVGRDAAEVVVDLGDVELSDGGFFKVTLEK